MNYFIHGDTHGSLSPINNFAYEHPGNGLIIVGDYGLNYYGDSSDERRKASVARLNINLFLIRGNHDRPHNELVNAEKYYHPQIKGTVLRESAYPNIFYLLDGETYEFNGKRTLVLGGAYSVDKFYRLANNWNWFCGEQLSQEEMIEIYEKYKGQHFDLILSHTCPYSWMPTDLFLSCIDQSSVDNTMEHWMDDFRSVITFDGWVWGHYHDDRDSVDNDNPVSVENPHKIMLLHETISLEEVFSNKNIFSGE
jgi:3-oxoacid CoA-transferase subunit A